jgi:hypothetical protein
MAMVLALSPAWTGPARAGSVTTAEAQALEGQLRAWFAALLGPHAALGDRPVRLTAEDDRYAVEARVAGKVGGSGVTVDGPPLTATARPLDGGSWALDDIRLPSPLHVAMPGGGAWTITMQDQQAHALLDPSLATTSTWDARIGSYATRWQGPNGERHTEAANLRTHVTWQPAAQGRIDVAETSSSELLATNARSDGNGIVSFSAAHTQLAAHIERLAPDRVPALVHAALDLAPLALAATSTTAAEAHTARAFTHLTPELRASLSAALDVASELLSGFDETVTMDDVHMRARGLDAAMRRLTVGAGAAAPDGRVRLRMHLAVDGLASASLPPGLLRGYMPHHISLAPRMSGVPADRLLALLHHVVASNGDDPTLAAEAMALLAEGPLAVGIDDFTADIGPAGVAGSGEMRIASAGQEVGEARVRMTGLDALIHDAQSVPLLQQALPVLIFLKGIGEQHGEATVWNVSYADGRLNVNGTDMSQMMPGITPPRQ